ncbi:MAG: Uma2 family endonuclease [Aphanocapsa sp. GSE-SYN-MK-11-07L]|nr:Uma2 family endonuclease [Aphanocapsa sp. GSE-SYN-MK-11-07L]
MYQTDPPRPARDYLPTMYDLPSEDPQEPGLPDEFHDFQPQLLRETFCPPEYGRDEVFVAADMNLYFDVHHPQWYKRPDWFAVVGVSRLYEQRDLRLSYVIWQEGVSPFIVVELLSPSTEKEDLGQTLREVNQLPTKWEVYQNILRVPYYVLFDHNRDRLRAFALRGAQYQEVDLEADRLWLPELKLGLGLWQGSFQDIERLWLRWYDPIGQWLPTSLESAEQQRERAEQEKQRADREHQRADRLAERLRQSGIEE